jgi:hypothetical protein
MDKVQKTTFRDKLYVPFSNSVVILAMANSSSYSLFQCLSTNGLAEFSKNTILQMAVLNIKTFFPTPFVIFDGMTGQW